MRANKRYRKKKYPFQKQSISRIKLIILCIIVGSTSIAVFAIVRNTFLNLSRAYVLPGSYESLPIHPHNSLTVPAETAPDVNIKLYPWELKDDTLDLTNSPNKGSLIDPKAPKLCTMFAPDRVPAITANYIIKGADTTMRNNPDSPALVGFQTTPSETIEMVATGILDSGKLENPYNVGDGYEAVVIYADENSVALHYENVDGTIDGYAVHILGVAPDESLLTLYRQLNSEGRKRMPALKVNDIIGTAIDNEIWVSIRDSGDFLDPRWKQEWWAGCGATSAPKATVTPKDPPGAQTSDTDVPIPVPTMCVPNWCFIKNSPCCFDPMCVFLGKRGIDRGDRCKKSLE